MPQAFVSCVNEGVEYLSQLSWPDQPATEVSRAACLAGLPSTTAAVVEELMARAGLGPADALPAVAMQSLTGEAEALLPAALCYRRGGDAGENVVSRMGCAAGRTFEDACLSAVLELIERDAAALWWIGGRPPRAVSAEIVASSGLAELTATLRRGDTERRTCLFDITTDLGVPCAAVWSTDPVGGDFACGLAARPNLGEAACAAMLELCQMELAHHLVREKLKRRNDQALTPVDRRHQARFEKIRPENCGPLFLARPPMRHELPNDFGHSALDQVVGRLRERGVSCFSVDLTRPEIGIPCARAFAPQLQPLPAAWTTGRMRAAIDETGGATPYTGGIDLL
jgi:ribosomal protein S12 methylthiotransferase accessory factor